MPQKPYRQSGITAATMHATILIVATRYPLHMHTVLRIEQHGVILC